MKEYARYLDVQNIGRVYIRKNDYETVRVSVHKYKTNMTNLLNYKY